MKRVFVLLLVMVLVLAGGTASGQASVFRYTEASELTLVGKLFNDTPNPYHRVDTSRFDGLTRRENTLVRMSSGIACAFRTNSTAITVTTIYREPTFPVNGNGISTRGYDLYIREKGEWLYAASAINPDDRLGEELMLISGMQEGRTYDCLLYLPLYSELESVKIGIEENAFIEPLENPFRHRIAVFGSSFTHGSSTSRAGMSYPAQLSRYTGLQMLSLGVSGNCLLQDSFCDILCAAPDVDAFVFDAFSNPSASTMKKRLFPFIEKLQAAHPGVPLVFQRTIWREQRNFNAVKDAAENKKMHTADSLMAIAVKKYKDVYYITPNATSKAHDTSVDGIHPGDHGYTLWAGSIRKPLTRILCKYGIR